MHITGLQLYRSDRSIFSGTRAAWAAGGSPRGTPTHPPDLQNRLPHPPVHSEAEKSVMHSLVKKFRSADALSTAKSLHASSAYWKAAHHDDLLPRWSSWAYRLPSLTWQRGPPASIPEDIILMFRCYSAIL